MSDGRPHRITRVLTVAVAAAIVGGAVGAFVHPNSTVGDLLVAAAIVALAVAGAYGTINDEPIVGALAGLGLLLLVESLPELGVFLFAGAFGFLLAATAVVAEQFFVRDDEEGADEDGDDAGDDTEA